jgi:hypothetical protein
MRIFFAKKRKDAIGEENVASSFVASRSENERAIRSSHIGTI